MLLKQNVAKGKALINAFTFYVFMWTSVQLKVDSCIKDTYPQKNEVKFCNWRVRLVFTPKLEF